jgi:hypothetical protein
MTHRIASTLIVLGLAALPLAGQAQDDDLLKKIINSPPVHRLAVIGSQQTNRVIKDATVQAGSALEVRVLSASSQPWDVAAQSDIHGVIKKGDMLIAVAWMKAAKTENGAPAPVTLRIQLASAPYTGLEQQTFNLTNEWAQYQLKTVATDNYAKNTTNIAAQLAAAKQTIDIGPVFVLDMGPDQPQG